ncbi:MAG: hypothetical protein IH944_11340 [Armatimonadetes bacterium]|nr:hypothetical protein [Armatimonadota bacterium]
MVDGHNPEHLEFTEEEAFALLTICMLYETPLDAVTESAVQKLAHYCRRNWIKPDGDDQDVDSELSTVG